MYSYGVLLLELLTGLRSIDRDRPAAQRKLVDWATPRLRHKRKVISIVDPKLEGKYSVEAAIGIAKLALRCLQRGPKSRPSMTEVVKSLEEIEFAAKKS